MLKINYFFEKTGVFRQKMEINYGGPFKNWLYFAQKLLWTWFIWLNGPTLSCLYAFTSKNTHNESDWDSVVHYFLNLKIQFFKILAFLQKWPCNEDQKWPEGLFQLNNPFVPNIYIPWSIFLPTWGSFGYSRQKIQRNFQNFAHFFKNPWKKYGSWKKKISSKKGLQF